MNVLDVPSLLMLLSLNSIFVASAFYNRCGFLALTLCYKAMAIVFISGYLFESSSGFRVKQSGVV